jgi:very-short-patch-repair endonuclease
MKRPEPDKPDSLDRVRALRRQVAEPERRLWHRLRNRQLGGLKFRRQVWLINYIADFIASTFVWSSKLTATTTPLGKQPIDSARKP